MNTEFYTLSLTRAELFELYGSLIERAMVEDDVRREKGLEPVAKRTLLEKCDALLTPTALQTEQVAQALEDELWEHSWYTFTDEWAWFRAKQEVMRELGVKAGTVDETMFQRLVEKQYEKNFETYIKEVEMPDHRAV